MREGGSSKTTRQGGGEGLKMPSFFGRKPRGAFGQTVFFLAGNRLSTVAFEKEVFLKSLACLAKRFSSAEVKFTT